MREIASFLSIMSGVVTITYSLLFVIAACHSVPTFPLKVLFVIGSLLLIFVIGVLMWKGSKTLTYTGRISLGNIARFRLTDEERKKITKKEKALGYVVFSLIIVGTIAIVSLYAFFAIPPSAHDWMIKSFLLLMLASTLFTYLLGLYRIIME